MYTQFKYTLQVVQFILYTAVKKKKTHSNRPNANQNTIFIKRDTLVYIRIPYIVKKESRFEILMKVTVKL